ncbi:hypothetical protein J6TS7_66740 [Paenibacillus dendritiformis]|uniref:terminase small subunit n=1 Tax=Paenibacillus melissococcoides TaxID=2912268 RepID=UPI001B15BD2B|nr:hypothetical protein J6TS7_66740 [Paenibacillus dendritiformis]
MALTAKQKAFVQEYLIDLNATQAAIRAGYSAKTASEDRGGEPDKTRHPEGDSRGDGTTREADGDNPG